MKQVASVPSIFVAGSHLLGWTRRQAENNPECDNCGNGHQGKPAADDACGVVRQATNELMSYRGVHDRFPHQAGQATPGVSY